MLLLSREWFCLSVLTDNEVNVLNEYHVLNECPPLETCSNEFA